MSYIKEQLEWAKQKEEEKEKEQNRATMNDPVYRDYVEAIANLQKEIDELKERINQYESGQ